MEADWEFEVGDAAPVIEAGWAGFVDLRSDPRQARDLPECAGFPALVAALEQLNAPNSPLWTAKCDVWPGDDSDHIDGGELDASPEQLRFVVCCYIDLLPREEGWSRPMQAEAVCRQICARLAAVALPCSRLDLIVRRAWMGPTSSTAEQMQLGMTAYLTGCAASEDDAQGMLARALEAFVEAVCADSTLQ